MPDMIARTTPGTGNRRPRDVPTRNARRFDVLSDEVALDVELVRLCARRTGYSCWTVRVLLRSLGWLSPSIGTSAAARLVGFSSAQGVRGARSAVVERLPHPLELPQLDAALALLSVMAPCTARDAELALYKAGLLESSMDVRAILAVASHAQRPETVRVLNVFGEAHVVPARWRVADRSLAELEHAAWRLTRGRGPMPVDLLRAELQPPAFADVVAPLRMAGWLVFGDMLAPQAPRRTALDRAVRGLLAVSPGLPFESLFEGVRTSARRDRWPPPTQEPFNEY
jgi:hypothetical protein